MALLWSLRGTSLTPRYAKGGKLYSNYLAPSAFGSPPVIANLGHASVFGGQAIDLRLVGDTRSLIYPALGNWVNNTRIFSVRVRIVPDWADGNPPSDYRVLRIGNLGSIQVNGGILIMVQDNGTIRVQGCAGYDTGANIFLQASPAQAFLKDQAFDIMITSDGARLYASFEGVEILDVALDSVIATSIFNSIVANSIVLAPYPFDGYINEVNIWDTCEPHEYAPRTDFLTCDDFDGTLSTDPGEPNVLDGQAYVINGVPKLGTHEEAPPATQPDEEDVREGVVYNDAANTGTLKVPSADDVRLGVDVDNTEGTCAVPDPADVREGVAVDDTEGTAWFSPAPTIRNFCDDIMEDIGTESLTDDEFAFVTITAQEFTKELYEELKEILNEREEVSATHERLKLLFQAHGVVIDPTAAAIAPKSNILIGGGVI